MVDTAGPCSAQCAWGALAALCRLGAPTPPSPGSRHINNMPLPGAFQVLEHWPSDRWVFLTFLTFDLATHHSNSCPWSHLAASRLTVQGLNQLGLP